jgi:hypothetical protein
LPVQWIASARQGERGATTPPLRNAACPAMSECEEYRAEADEGAQSAETETDNEGVAQAVRARASAAAPTGGAARQPGGGGAPRGPPDMLVAPWLWAMGKISKYG